MPRAASWPNRLLKAIENILLLPSASDTRLSRNSTRLFEFCSGLVDSVVCVGRHGGGGHCLALAGERFVGRVAEDIAEVSNRGGDFGDPRCGDGTACEAGDGGRRFVASEPVENSGEDGQRDADRRGVARIVVVADCQSEVIECGHGAAVFGLKSCQIYRQA